MNSPTQVTTRMNSPLSIISLRPNLTNKNAPTMETMSFSPLSSMGRYVLREGRKPSASSPPYSTITLMPLSCWNSCKLKLRKMALGLSGGYSFSLPSSSWLSACRSCSFSWKTSSQYYYRYICPMSSFASPTRPFTKRYLGVSEVNTVMINTWCKLTVTIGNPKA